MPEQLTFELPLRTSLERGDFFVSEPNTLAVKRIEQTHDWANSKLALIGPQGAGKTHLAHVWAEAAGGVVTLLSALKAAQVVEVTTPTAIEVPEALDPEAEQVLFHLHNHMAVQHLPLLLISRATPARWPIVLPDLKSRMEATDVVQIATPDDALLAAVLIKLFNDRQLLVAPNLIDWLTKRMDRSFAEAQRLVAEIDKAALSEGRAVTRALAQRILDITPNSAP